MSDSPRVAVIIPAFRAEATIATAVGSALASPHVAEVLVIDDASGDATADCARAAAAGDERLRVLVQAENQGPAAARNRAIAESDSPLLAILDADDRFLPGRFDAILAAPDWDLCADNILFYREEAELAAAASPAAEAEPRTLGFSAFIRGNMTVRGQPRGELGFLKPVMRRAMIEDLGLSYAPQCRLGEDFLLYATALARGAGFRVIANCGYAALVRGGSLSARHRTADLAALYAEEQRLLAELPLDAADRRLLERHAASTRRRLAHRQVLDSRHDHGLVRGMLAAAMQPSAIADIFHDRVRPAITAPPTPRRLLAPGDLARLSA